MDCQDTEPGPHPEPASRDAGDHSTIVDAENSRPVRGGRAVPVIEGYEILRELGRGGMGVVYEARHRKLNRTVALKMVLAGEHASERVMARFLAEAEIAAGLQHTNIIRIYELGEAMGLPFLAMELAGGCSMADRMQVFGNDFRGIAGFFEKLARATHWAHQHAVIHRDLKPGNVLIGSDGEPKIADFGLAKRLDDDPDRPVLTKSGEQMGTPAYMAPEQAFPEMGDIGPGTDVYSLGVMLYEVLAGKVPFKGSSHAEVLAKLRNEDPSSPAWLRTGLPRDLETICLKCLRKKPRERYATAGELADDLLRFQQDEPIHAKPPSPLTKTFRWVRRHRVSMSIIATILVAAGIAGAVWTRQHYLWKQDQELHVTEYTAIFPGFVKLHGQYRGAGKPLTEEEAAHRGLSYRIMRAGREGRCLRLTCTGADGKPSWLFASTDVLVPGLLDGVARHRLPCIFELRYNGDGQVAEERVMDASGLLITRFRYTYPEGYNPDVPQTAYITGDFVDEFSAPLKTATGLSSVQLERDRGGRERRLLYADAHGQPLEDKNGTGGLELSYHPEGMIAEVIVLDKDGKRAANREGRAIVKTEWAAPGRPVSEACFNLEGKPVTVNGAHLARMECDRWGNLVATRYFALDGVTPARRSVPGQSGPSEIIWTFDGRGRAESLTSAGYDTNVAGFSSIVTRFDWTTEGLINREVAMDAEGKPVRGGAGYHTSEKIYDALGRVLRVERKGFDPARTGYFRDVETMTWNAAGNKQRSELTFFDEKGQPAREKSEGVGRKVKEYGPDGLPARETISGLDPERFSYQKQVLEYEWQASDAAGARRFPGLVDEGPTDAAENSATEPAGVAFARAGRAKPGPIQMAINSRSAKRSKTRGRYFYENGEPAATSKGNSEWERTFDAQGREATEIHSGFHSSEYPYARAIITTTYNKDDKGRTIVWRYEDEIGKPARNKSKYLEYSETYDEGGHVLRIGEDGYKEDAKRLYTRVEITVGRDKAQKEKEMSWNYFDKNRQPVRNEEGYRTYTEVHDDAGRAIRRIQAGYDETVQSYDTETIETEWSGKNKSHRRWTYTDAAGKRVRYKGDYMDYDEYYDEQGKFSRLVISGHDPLKFPFFKKVTQTEARPDEQTVWRVTHFEEENGQPARGFIGELESREARSRDDGRVLTTIATGFDEARHGFSKMKAQHDDSGGIGMVEYSDSRGQSVTRVRPFIRRILPGSPAASLNLKTGDAILAYNDSVTGNMFDYVQNTQLQGGTMKILRDGKPILLTGIPAGELGIYLEDRALPP